MLYPSFQWGRAALTVLWYAGRSLKHQRLVVLLLVIQNLKNKASEIKKNRALSIFAVGAEGFDSIVVCWQF